MSKSGFRARLLPAVLLATAVCGPGMASAAATFDSETRAIDEAIARHALFAMLVADHSEFRRDWEKRLRLRLQLDTSPGADSSVHTGLALAMDAAKPYLMRASDAASNRFLDSLARLIAEGEKDPEVCLAYVETGGSDAPSAQRREMVESRLGELLVNDVLESLTAVVSSGRNGEKRVLSRQELQPTIQPVILDMVEKNGLEALQGLAAINNRLAPPLQRCRAMSRMLDAFKAQPEARRAMLTRTLFSGALPSQ